MLQRRQLQLAMQSQCTHMCAAPSQHRRLTRVRRSLFALALLLLASVPVLLPSLPLPLTPASATYVDGSKRTSKSWVYLEKFCFDENGGQLRFTFYEGSDVTANTQMVSFYADQRQEWQEAYNDDSLSCVEKRAKARRTFPLSILANSYYNHTHVFPVTGVVPRWWYVALSNCEGGPGGSEGAIEVDYFALHFTNTAGIFNHEFSKDEQGILQASIFFLILYSLLLFLLAWIKRHAKQKSMQYTVVKYVFASMAVEWLALLLLMAHYAAFAHDGRGAAGLQHAHFFFDFVSNLILLYAVLNVCKGWTISTNFIVDKRLSYVILTVLFLLYVALFAWVQSALDPASVLHPYETEPGWALVGVRVALCLWACWCTVRTLRLESDLRKRQFYAVWLALAVLWLVSLPVIAGVARHIDTWRQRVAIFALSASVQAAMYLALIYVFRPFRSNRYVAILQPNESRAFGNNNMQVFPASPAAEVQFSTI